MDRMEIYNHCRAVPKEAQKTIGAGRLKGFTDINAMWRIQKLTELFGPCGIGWKYTINREWMERGEDGVVAAFMDISLYYKHNDEWSEAIPGMGGSSFVAKETKGLYTSDECYKMALTDALSVACKALGMGADIYWDKGRSKYDAIGPVCAECGKTIYGITTKDGNDWSAENIVKYSKGRFGRPLCVACQRKITKFEAAQNKAYDEAQMSAHEDAGDRV